MIAEAYNDSREIGLFVELAAVTGARPSQIVRLEVRDVLDGSEPRLMMPASRKGKGRKAKSHYPVPISADLAERLAAMDRSANAPLLTRPGGKPWRRSNQAYPFRRVASACGQDPAEVTMYALRHSSIVRQLLAGVPVLGDQTDELVRAMSPQPDFHKVINPRLGGRQLAEQLRGVWIAEVQDLDGVTRDLITRTHDAGYRGSVF